MNASYFYSRPCGRGDESKKSYGQRKRFLLTPLREGRRKPVTLDAENGIISTHAPAGGATGETYHGKPVFIKFLLTPLREGRRVNE